MARISKGFAISTAILGVLAFCFGLGTAICSFKLTQRASGLSIDTHNYYDLDYNRISLNSNYWWGGMLVSISLILLLFITSLNLKTLGESGI